MTHQDPEQQAGDHPANDPLSHLVAEIAEVAEYLWQKGWAERNSGNISVRVNGLIREAFPSGSISSATPLSEPFLRMAGDLYLVTGTGCRMRDVSREPDKNLLMIRITAEGDGYEILSPPETKSGPVVPTSELISHLMIHRYLKEHQPTKRAIVHTHPSELIALSHSPVYKEESLLNRILWGMLPETTILVPEGLGVIPYRITGSSELAYASVNALQSHSVLLWEKHGCLAVAPTVMEAFDLIDVMVKSADILLKCLHAGFSPEGLTDEQIEELRDRFHRK
ncbi:MAG: rhamnulose-1-phosphate aldolase [Bacteroidales bacterium]|nr:rhamnulose-1-phosphate aldolase [Bacteroidales bacterium]